MHVRLEGKSMSDYLKRLVDSGLSEREAKLYLALIEHPGVTGSELQRFAGIPRTKVYETLHRMVERKLCVERQAGDVKRYSPVEPRLVMELRKQQMNAQIVEIERLGTELMEIYEKSDKEPVTLEYVEVLNSREQIFHWMNYLIENCHDELLVFSKIAGAVQTLKECDDMTLGALKRVKVLRSIYEYGRGFSPELYDCIQRWHDAGEKSRFIRYLPTRIMIFDGARALTPARDSEDHSTEAGLLVTGRQLAQAFRMLFEHTWNEAIPFEEFMANFDRIMAESTVHGQPHGPPG
jgi:sugar-specific transcriptional regulator TrmB